MSYSVSSGRVETSPGQNDSGGVSVAVADQPAGVADELALGQFQPLLGSRSTVRTRHGRVRGRHHHHRPASPLGVLDEGAFGSADGSVRRLASHGGLGEELRLEVLDGDSAMVSNDSGGPFPSHVLPLTGNLLVLFRNRQFGFPITLRTRLSRLRLTSSHHPLVASQFPLGLLPELGMRQVIGGISGGGNLPNTPVDADGGIRIGHRFIVAPDDETGVPVAEGVSVDAHAGRIGREFSGPDDGNAQPASKPESVVLEGESIERVIQGRQGFLGRLELATPLALGALGAEVTDSLLLSNRGTVSQPFMIFPPRGQSRVFDPDSIVLQEGGTLIPHPPTPVPFAQQLSFRNLSGSQTVGVANGVHSADYTTS